MMKTVYKVVNQDKTNSILVIENKEKRDLQPIEILVEVKASATYKSDTQVFHNLLSRIQRLQIPGGLTVAGVVSDVGADVSHVRVGDRVAGILPVTAAESGISEYCIVEEGEVVCLPESVDYTSIAGCLVDGVQAYTALSYLAHVTSGDTVFVYDGASSWGLLMIQLASLWGAKVMTSVSSLEERSLLEHLASPPALILERDTKVDMMVSHVLEETGNLGVDVVIDNGIRLFDREDDCSFVGEDFTNLLPKKHDILSMLTMGGRWVTCHPSLQLDPPDSEMLYLRGASVSFLCPHFWTLCPTRRGKLLHILQDLISRLERKELVPKSARVMSFTSLLDSIEDNQGTIEPGTVIAM